MGTIGLHYNLKAIAGMRPAAVLELQINWGRKKIKAGRTELEEKDQKINKEINRNDNRGSDKQENEREIQKQTKPYCQVNVTPLHFWIFI